MLFLFFAFSWAATITQSAGIVGQDVVTSREVQIAAVIDKILNEPNANKTTGLYEIQIKDEKFPELTTTYLLERAAVLEGESFSVGQVKDAELKEAFNQVEKVTGSKSYWQGLEADPATVKKIILIKLISRNFIKIKSESMSGIITDAEAKTYFERNRLKFGSSTLDNFKENIKVYLAQQQKEEKLRSWFELLKKKYKIRNLLIESMKAPQ